MTFSKKYIENYVTDSQIMSRYISTFDEGKIKRSGQKGINISSPFCEDKNPSFLVQEKNGRLHYKCFSTGNGGDVFQLVADLNNLDGKTQFRNVLKIIYQDFKLNGTNGTTSYHSNNGYKCEYYPKFTKTGLVFWEQYGITEKILNQYKVKQLKRFSYKKSKFENKLIFEFTINGRRKWYIPKQEGINKKYVYKEQTKDDIFGLDNLKFKPYILVCEGEKDALCAASHGYTAISFQSCNTIPSNKIIREIRKLTKCLIICYDNDKAGKDGREKLKKVIDSKSLQVLTIDLPEDVKDIAEYLPTNKDDFKQLIEDAKEDIKGRDFFQYKKTYCKYSYDKAGKQYITQLTNFLIESEAFILSEYDSQRIVRIISDKQRTKFIPISTRDFVSVDKFRNLLESKGNYLFFGNTLDLLKIKEQIFEFADEAEEVTRLGYHKNANAFFLSNGMIKDDRFHYPDKLGMVNGYYLSTASEHNKFSQSIDLATAQKIKFTNRSQHDLKSLIDELVFLYGETKAYIGLSYLLSSLCFKELLDKTGSFPLLNIYGQAQSGKSSFAEFLCALFSIKPEKVSLKSVTPTGLIRKLAQTVNIPVFFDEFKNDIGKFKIEVLKNVFDGIGKTTGQKSNDERTRQTPVYSPAIVVGQELPLDEALLTRLISLSFAKKAFNPDAKKRVNALKLDFNTKGWGNILIHLLSYRKAIIEQFDSEFEPVANALFRLVSEKNDTIGMRLINNYATILTPLVIAILEGLDIGIKDKLEASNKILSTVADNIIKQSADEKDNDETNVFWQIMETLIQKKIITQNVDYHRGNKEIRLRKSAFDAYQKYYYDVYKKQPIDGKNLKKYLEEKPYFKKGNNRRTIQIGDVKKQTRFHVICDIDLLSDAADINFINL